MALELVVFDLDGVLLDSAAMVAEAVESAAKRYSDETGQRVIAPTQEKIFDLMGQPNDVYIRELGYEIDADGWKQMKKLVIQEEQRLFDEGWGSLYDGIEALMHWLKNVGLPCAIASNCGREYLTAFLDRFDISEQFSIAVCSDDFPGAVKADLLKLVLEKADVLGSETVYLGDRALDETAARQIQVGFLACLWGFGHKDRFSPGIVKCDHPRDVMAVLRRLVPLVN